MKTIDYKILPNSPGIYLITNIVNSKMYIGSTVNLRKRKNNHLVFLRSSRHSNIFFQSEYNQYGENSFEFKVLEVCEFPELLRREQHFLDTLWIDGLMINHDKSAKANYGESHPRYGKSHSSFTKDKIKEKRANQIVKHSEETRQKIGDAHKGQKVNMNHIMAMVKAREGKPVWNKGLTLVNRKRP